MSGGFTLSQNGAYGQTNNWIHLNGWHGIYSTNNGAHFFPNQNSSYGSWETRGSRNGWGGIWDNYSGVNWMHQSDGSGGLYKESNGRWYIYHNTAHNCTAIGSSNTTSGYAMQVTGNAYVTGFLNIGVANGSAPFVVASSTQVTNLNSQYLNGYSSDTANTANTIVRRDGSGNFNAGIVSGSLFNGKAYSILCNDNDRNASTRLPTSVSQAAVFNFTTASTTSTGGNYSGTLTFSPYTGQTSTGGDGSYQLAFGGSAANAGGVPQLNIRTGIDSTWNSWYRIPLYGTSYGGSLYADNFYYNSDTNSRWVNGYQLILRGASPTVYFRDTDANSAMIHVNSNIFYVLRGANDTESWSAVNGRWPLEIDLTNNNAQFGGKVSDQYGDLRTLPENAKTSAYTLAAADTGRLITITTGGITVPASVFSVGQVVTIYNKSGSNQTITQGSGVTLRQAGTANTGNRTLAQYGVATVICISATEFVISGNGIT